MLWLGLTAASAGVTADVATAWRLVDYMAVDYADAVHDGEIANAAEYEEMKTFSRDIRSRIEALPDAPPELLAQVGVLEQDVVDRVSPTVLRAHARSLGDALLRHHPIPAAPPAAPSIADGQTLFLQHCASCHGDAGTGDGPASGGMDPAPVDFTDVERARQRSVFALYQVTTQGLEGTPMRAFTELSDAERWDVATYASTLAFPDSTVDLTPAVRAQVPDLARWASVSAASLAPAVPDVDVDAVLGQLRRRPELVNATTEERLSVVRTLLASSHAAWREGDVAGAERLALAAYLDGFEPVEAMLASTPAITSAVEHGFNGYRAALVGNGPVDDALAALHVTLDDAEAALDASASSFFALALAAAVLLLREGAEALLVVVALLAVVRRTGRPGLAKRVHAGWIGALLAGVATWWAATTLITVSGAQREIIEGAGGLLAAVVLVTVGVWMHDKSLAGRWQAYVDQQARTALEAGNGLGLVGLVFLVVYREVFETILFYTSLWAEGGTGPVLTGFLVGATLLAVLAGVLNKMSLKLPIGTFFGVSAWVMAALAIVLAGKGVGGLQEAGLVGVHPIAMVPSIGMLGLNGTVEALLAQVITLVVVAGAMLRRR